MQKQRETDQEIHFKNGYLQTCCSGKEKPRERYGVHFDHDRALPSNHLYAQKTKPNNPNQDFSDVIPQIMKQESIWILLSHLSLHRYTPT